MNIQKFFFVVLFTIVSITLSAQILEKGDITFQAGVGLLPTFFLDASETVVPPISLTANYRFLNALSVGGYAGYSEYNGVPNENFDGSVNQFSSKSFLGGLRLSAHSTKVKNWDVYGGFQVAYSKPSVVNNIIVPSESPIPETRVNEGFLYSGFIGATGFVSKNIGLFGELGYGISLVNLGVTLKL